MTPEKLNLPDSVWDSREYTSVHAVVLHADVEGGALIASTLSPGEYDRFIDVYHRAIYELVTELRRQRIPVGDFSIQGGCCKIQFYDPDEVQRNYFLDGPDPVKGQQRRNLIEESRANNEHLVISALRAAIQIKNMWMIQQFTVDRVRGHQSPWEIGIGISYGRVFLKNRTPGKRYIEGYPLHRANFIQSISAQGSFSHIFLSRHARDVLLRSVLKHSQLSQRVFLNEYKLPVDSAPATTRNETAYELRWYHRIGIHVTQDVVDQYDAVFKLDPANSWAYYQLVDYYSYVKADWNRVFELASIMRVTNPDDEKALLDLAKYYLQLGKHAQSNECARNALRINDSFDVAYEHLAVLASEVDDIPTQIKWLRKTLQLSPRSAVNNFNIGLALLEAGEFEEGFYFVQQALRIYPGYKDWQIFRESLLRLKQEGKLPDIFDIHLKYSDDD